MPAVECTIFDLAAIVIRHDLAAADTAADKHPFAGKGVAELAPASGDEIGRPAIERRREFAGRHARAGNDRLIIAGKKAAGVAKLVDADRAEIVFKEFSCTVFVERNGLARPFANVFQRGWDRCQFAAAALLDVERTATRQEGSEGRSMIVAVPAVEIGPVDRFVLR